MYDSWTQAEYPRRVGTSLREWTYPSFSEYGGVNNSKIENVYLC
jgi:hypothetical protein